MSTDTIAVSSCLTGKSTWCEIGRHDNCAHRIGGPQEHGVWFPECWVGIRHGEKILIPPAQTKVIRPSHRWHCGCECHTRGQLSLFGRAA